MDAKGILKAIISEMDDKQRNRIINTAKEYVIVRCSIFNAGTIINIKCTNKYVNVRNSSGYDYIIDSASMAKYVHGYIINDN